MNDSSCFLPRDEIGSTFLKMPFSQAQSPDMTCSPLSPTPGLNSYCISLFCFQDITDTGTFKWSIWSTFKSMEGVAFNTNLWVLSSSFPVTPGVTVLLFHVQCCVGFMNKRLRSIVCLQITTPMLYDNPRGLYWPNSSIHWQNYVWGVLLACQNPTREAWLLSPMPSCPSYILECT